MRNTIVLFTIDKLLRFCSLYMSFAALRSIALFLGICCDELFRLFYIFNTIDFFLGITITIIMLHYACVRVCVVFIGMCYAFVCGLGSHTNWVDHKKKQKKEKPSRRAIYIDNIYIRCHILYIYIYFIIYSYN